MSKKEELVLQKQAYLGSAGTEHQEINTAGQTKRSLRQAFFFK